MTPEPGSPRDWLRFAQSDLAIAQMPATPPVLREALCFHAQQAVEKSMKAILILHRVDFPRTHNLKLLYNLLKSVISLPPILRDATELSDYAAQIRYPGDFEAESREDHERAVRLAQAVVEWAEKIIAEAEKK